MFFNFRIGNKIINAARMNAENMYYDNNQSTAVNWRWRKDGDIPICHVLFTITDSTGLVATAMWEMGLSSDLNT
jgi:hypothetical protein